MELIVKCAGATTSTPSEGRNEKQFECPLCVDVFERFPQLKWHLLSMHPRRPMIMELVKERYGMSERDAARTQSGNSGSQCAQEPSKFCVQTAENVQQLMGKAATTKAFQLRHKAVAAPQIHYRCKESSGKSEEISMEFNAHGQKTWPKDDGSTWDSYLSFCLYNDGAITLETVHRGPQSNIFDSAQYIISKDYVVGLVRSNEQHELNQVVEE